MVLSALHAIGTPRITPANMACNGRFWRETWRTISVARHVNTPYQPIRGRAAPKSAGIALKRPPLAYIFAAAREAPRDRATITATDGTRKRSVACASPHDADVLEERLTKDRAFAAKWLKTTSPVQLHLPLGDRPVQLDLEDAIAATPPKACR